MSVYVSEGVQRCGIGRALYERLFGLLREQGFYNAFAGISLPNEASVGMHQALGFAPVGVYRRAGYKLGAWHDVMTLGLALREPQPADGPPAAPLTMAQLRERGGPQGFAWPLPTGSRSGP